MTAPLEGIKVVEMAEVMQGPFAAQTLADYGADVIKVERSAGDLMRGLDRDATDAGKVSAYFAAVNRNKRSIVLDLKREPGLDALHGLLGEADVFVHSYRPDAIRRLGLSYEDLSERHPTLVYASASGWGESGPLSHKAGQDLLAQSISGMARTVGKQSLTSHLNPVATVDFASGSLLAQGVLAALLQRVKTGRGQHVSVNLLDTALNLQMLEAAARLMYDAELNWVKQWWSGEFETADGYLTVVGFFRENAVALACKALGMEDLSTRPEFEGVANQAASKEEVNRLLAPAIKSLTTAEAVTLFDSVDLLCSPMLTLAECLEHPQVHHNDPFVRVRVSGQEEARVVGRAVKLSDMAPRDDADRVPLLGEDTESVLVQLDRSPGDRSGSSLPNAG
jgi:crotonobetainyl-CoA:carnitine CoA-transferase CaiB-like acyl-CoA transferase